MYNTVKLINRETGKTATKVNAKNKALYGKGQSGSWYEVTGKLKGKEVSGYSHKDYIKITSGKVPK